MHLATDLGEFPQLVTGISFAVAIAVIFGAFGGLVQAMGPSRTRSVVTPGRNHGEIQMGCAGDLLAGSAAAVGLLFLAPALGIDFTGGLPTPVESIRLIGASSIAGFAGRPLLERLTRALEQRIDAVEEEQQELAQTQSAQQILADARLALLEEDFERAEQALAAIDCETLADPELRAEVQYWYGLAIAYAHESDLPALEHAIALFDAVLEHSPLDDGALYNRACTKAAHLTASRELERQPLFSLETVVSDLAEAIDIRPSWREALANDPDLAPFLNELQMAELLDPDAAMTNDEHGDTE